ncbi:serine/threonine protein kinase [Maudiozyma humilis]|uniref:Serine/threonine protein kinase n=1 Tax=Maudiozyma humilis TaxID=51915 RepID=A0AAV5RQ17_MAUHU|nr:serine/threonine protein kinase [Kazachstania humilis]
MGLESSEKEKQTDPKTPKLNQQEFGLPPNIFQTSNAPVIPPGNTPSFKPPSDSQIGSASPTGDIRNPQVRTPLAVSIPTFEGINSLPTPMAYTPLSPNMLASMSPTIQMQQQPFQQLNIRKRRNNNLNTALNGTPGIDNLRLQHHDIRNSKELERLRNTGASNRVVSELIPPPAVSAQRVVSLPTVNEEDVVASKKEEMEEKASELRDIEEFTSEDDILTGYLIGDNTTTHQWRKVKHLGSGNFSNVTLYQTIDEFDKYYHEVAVKKIKYPDDLMDAAEDTLSRLESSLTRELNVLKILNHPSIVKLYGINNPIFIENTRPLTTLLQQGKGHIPPCEMIMSYCNGGDFLAELAKCQGGLAPWIIQRLFAELVVAVKYLHDNSVIHRDLKLENILLRYTLEEISLMMDSPQLYKQNMIELADFGLCKTIKPGEMCTARCGSEDYVSPEILMGVPYDGHLTDTWALGVVLYSLLEDRLPFDPPRNATQRQKSRPVAHRIARFEWRWFKTLQEPYLDGPKDIVKNTLTRKNMRWNIDQIYNTPYIQEMVTKFEF